jgi:hypothetical protein
LRYLYAKFSQAKALSDEDFSPRSSPKAKKENFACQIILLYSRMSERPLGATAQGPSKAVAKKKL